MGKLTKIEALGLGERVLAMAAEGRSSREIVSILAADGVSVSQPSVIRFLTAVRRERAAVAKAAVAEHLKDAIPADLEILRRLRDTLIAWWCSPDLRIGERLLVMDRLLKVIDTRLKYSGAEQNDQQIIVKWISDDDDSEQAGMYAV